MSENYKIIISDYQTYAKDIRAVRNEVFVLEQSVPVELEHDEHDEKALHVVVYTKGLAVGTGRMLDDGHIGRIAVLKPYREKGIGNLIMKKLFERAKENQLTKVWLSSQWHAHRFYCNLGFVCIGDQYQEAGIDHIKMVKAI